MDSMNHDPDLEYDDRTVIVTYRDKGKVQTIEGLCVTYRPGRAAVVKPPKKPYGEMILDADIIKIEIVAQNNLITQTAIKPVTVRDVRRHLLNYHGWTLSQVNKVSDEDALVTHEIIHKKSVELNADDLGHNHDKK